MTYANESMTDYEEQINWDEVGAVVPKGQYDFVIEKADYKPTGAGKHMAVVQFKVNAAYEVANAEAASNKSVFENFVFTQAAGFRVKGFAKAAGIDLPPSVTKAAVEEWCAGIVGTEVGGEVEHREWQGDTRCNIKKFFSAGGAEAVEEEAEDAGEDAADPGEAEPEAEPESELEVETAGEEEAEPEAPKTGIRAAVAAQNGAKANGHTNGHANGKSAVAAKLAAKTVTPPTAAAKKPSAKDAAKAKTQARR